MGRITEADGLCKEQESRVNDQGGWDIGVQAVSFIIQCPGLESYGAFLLLDKISRITI